MDFDKILEDPKYQAAFDKKVSIALDTAKKKWDEELVAKQKELEENAKLTAEEKAKKEVEKIAKERDDLKAYQTKREMIDKAKNHIKEKGYDPSIEDLIDLGSFADENDMAAKLEKINTNFSTKVSSELNNKLKENGYDDLAGKLGADGKNSKDFDFNFTPIK